MTAKIILQMSLAVKGMMAVLIGNLGENWLCGCDVEVNSCKYSGFFRSMDSKWCKEIAGTVVKQREEEPARRALAVS
jgi:hypothetical protein